MGHTQGNLRHEAPRTPALDTGSGSNPQGLAKVRSEHLHPTPDIKTPDPGHSGCRTVAYTGGSPFPVRSYILRASLTSTPSKSPLEPHAKVRENEDGEARRTGRNSNQDQHWLVEPGALRRPAVSQPAKRLRAAAVCPPAGPAQ